MAVPYTFGTATASIPLSQLDSNFATVITLGNTAIQLGNTVTTLNNMTLANVTISSGNITLTNVSATTANVTTANVVTMIITGNETVQGNTTVTGTITGAKLIPTGSSVTGNGMYLPATNSVGISTNGTNAVYIDASQNVGIGTSSPSFTLDISAAGPRIRQTATTGTNSSLIQLVNSGGTAYVGLDNSAAGISSAYALALYHSGAYPITFSTNGTERMRIDSSGNLLVGGITSPSYSMKMTVSGGISSIGANQFNIAGTTSGSDFEWVLRQGSRQLFYVTNATVVANLSATGVWTNASDARYKENITDSQYGLSTVMALKPRTYNLINQTDKPQIGFIAQEVLEVIPEVVESVHNAVTEEDRYTLSYGNMVAVLTKAIQEQQALITSLTARIEALEAK